MCVWRGSWEGKWVMGGRIQCVCVCVCVWGGLSGKVCVGGEGSWKGVWVGVCVAGGSWEGKWVMDGRVQCGLE